MSVLDTHQAPLLVIEPGRSPSSSCPVPSDVTVFVPVQEHGVLVYDPPRSSLCLFSSLGECRAEIAGPRSEFGPLHSFASMMADHHGRVYVATGSEVVQFDLARGEVTTLALPEDLSRSVFYLAPSTDSSILYVSSHDARGVWTVSRYEPATAVATAFHKDAGRAMPGADTALNFWIVRPAVDQTGRVLIPDQRDYRVWVYDSHGELERVFERPTPPECFSEADLFLRVAQHKFPIAALSDLPEALRCPPPIVGILVTTNDNYLVFTTYRNKAKQYRIDVYDTSWNYLGSDYHHNAIRLFPYHIVGNQVFVADIGLDADVENVHLSRLEAPQIPTRILAFPMTW